MKLRPILLVAFATFGLISLVLYRPMLDDWLNRTQKRELAIENISQLRASLYVPSGVFLLKETRSFRLPNYFDNCYGAEIKIVYGTDRSVDEIRKEYSQALLESDWKPDPGYKSYDYFMVYNKGPENNLMWDASQDVTNPTNQNYPTVYSVFLNYVTPSYNYCTG